MISLAQIRIHKFTKDHCGTVLFGWCLMCICFFVCFFLATWATQMCNCANTQIAVPTSSNFRLLSLKLHICVMVDAQLSEVTAAADGTELSSKRVSELSRRYHHHKKQLRQSATMADVSSDAWVCPSCLYKNQDYQRCMGPGCDEVRPQPVGHI